MAYLVNSWNNQWNAMSNDCNCRCCAFGLVVSLCGGGHRITQQTWAYSLTFWTQQTNQQKSASKGPGATFSHGRYHQNPHAHLLRTVDENDGCAPSADLSPPFNSCFRLLATGGGGVQLLTVQLFCAPRRLWRVYLLVLLIATNELLSL